MPDEAPIELYTDSMRFSVTPYGVNFTFGLTDTNATPSKPVPARETLILRMSLEHAKIMALMLRRNLKTYEREHSLKIPLPYALYTQLGVAEEDWGDA